MPSKHPRTEFFDKDKKADVPPGQIYSKDVRRFLKEYQVGKPILNTEKITDFHFKKDD